MQTFPIRDTRHPGGATPRLIAAAAAALCGFAAGADFPHRVFTHDFGDDHRWFGSSVAVDPGEGIAAVGAVWDESAFIFDLETGAQLAELRADVTTNDNGFGTSVAIGAGMVAVGSPDSGAGGLGEVYLFDARTGERLRVLTASEATEADFGFSVAMDGATLVAGDPLDIGLGFFTGAAYVFDAATGERLHRLTPAGQIEGLSFGRAVAVGGGVVAVCSPGSPRNNVDPAVVHVFDAATADEIAAVRVRENQAGGFGASVAVDGDRLLVGAVSEAAFAAPAQTGAAYLFDLPSADLVGLIQPIYTAPYQQFGRAVGLDGGLAVVGAPHSPQTAGPYALIADARTGTHLTTLHPDGNSSDDKFGDAVAVRGDAVLIGDRWDDTTDVNAGSAHLYNVRLLGDVYCGPADLALPVGTLDLLDVVAFVTAYGAGDDDADFDGSGIVDAADIDAFITAFVAGCP